MARQANPSPREKRGYWIVRLRGRDVHLGKDKRKAFLKFYRLMAREYDTEQPGRPETVAGAIDRWRGLHPNPKHQGWLRRFAEFAGRTYLDDVTDDLLHNYHDHLLKAEYQPTDKNGKAIGKVKRLSLETIRNYIGDAGSVLRLAAKRKWCAMPELPVLEKTEYRDRGTDRAELWSKLDGLGLRAGRILKFLASTGARPSEGCGLKWEHVQFAISACVIPRHKTSKATGEPRVIPLTDEALDVLHKTPHTGEYVFLSRLGKPYTPRGLRSIAVRRLGVNPYALRHCYAQACIDEGVVPEVVTRMMGHRTSRMVWTYARIRDEQMIQAASRLRLRKDAAAG